jgi:spore germination cell wall hydrolase CwlJ-like protein
MSRKADAEKKEKEQAAAAIGSIEKAAQERFEADQRAAQEAAGKWVWMEDSQYYYNAKYRCADIDIPLQTQVCSKRLASDL